MPRQNIKSTKKKRRAHKKRVTKGNVADDKNHNYIQKIRNICNYKWKGNAGSIKLIRDLITCQVLM